MNAIDKAITFATRAHTGQCRKGTKIPYIVHPLGVAKILIQCGCLDHIVIAGILHDTVEDTPTTIEEIRQEFGFDAAALVDTVTEPDKNDTWENRKKHTIGMVKTLSEEAAILVLADKLDNIRAIREDLEVNGDIVWQRFKCPRECQKWYYESLLAAFTDKSADEQSRTLLEHFKAEVTRVFGGVPHEPQSHGDVRKSAAASTVRDALNIFNRYIEQGRSDVLIYDVTDVLPAYCRPYGLPRQNCWFVIYSSSRLHFCSSSLIAISKRTGEVVYDGSANDEG